mmetsp:Transcript_136302/g.236480  ORF Transcript_136302/g.236480 Transcript_136302/m.236480 type:complete len:135 (+) Transcript_136302:108-512(+)
MWGSQFARKSGVVHLYRFQINTKPILLPHYVNYCTSQLLHFCGTLCLPRSPRAPFGTILCKLEAKCGALFLVVDGRVTPNSTCMTKHFTEKHGQTSTSPCTTPGPKDAVVLNTTTLFDFLSIFVGGGDRSSLTR